MTWRALAALLSGLLIGVALTQFGLTIMRVSGESMAPTLHGGQFVVLIRPPLHATLELLGVTSPLLVDGAVLAIRDPQAQPATARGWPARLVDWAAADLLVKRVVGLPGETIAFKSGERYLNGALAPEPWLDPAYAGTSNVSPTVIGQGEVYVLGDDRLPLASRDSRTFGALGTSGVRGTVVLAFRALRRDGDWQWPVAPVDQH